MQCSAEQIKEKRRLALERLKRTKDSQTQAQASNPTATSNGTSTATSPGTSTKPTSTFYGSDTQKKANELNEYENKMKQQHHHGQASRILSQPYPKRDPNATSSSATSNNNAPKFLKPFEKVVTCTCSMISPTRFQVVTCGYSEPLINVFKTIPTRSYSNLKIPSYFQFYFEYFCYLICRS